MNSCKQCGKPVPPRNVHHCSAECAKKSAWSDVECGQCGQIFNARSCYINRGQMKYCSESCSQVASRSRDEQIFNGLRYSVDNNGYMIRNDKRGHRKMHRDVWEHHNGVIPDGHLIHHINHNKTDNRIENLELMSFGEHSRKHNMKRDKEHYKNMAEARWKAEK